MKPSEIVNNKSAEAILAGIMGRIHADGPIRQDDLETLSYIKYFHPNVFRQKENQLMYMLGLFYKVGGLPKDLIGFSYSVFEQAIYEDSGKRLTPVQASIRKNILNHKYFSFSAPTSAGKSFLFRDLIKDEPGDIVIVVPSRALIAEYMLEVRKIVSDDKKVLVLQFIEDVNKIKTSRRIFVVTPERASEIFRLSQEISPTLFLYDEAQISEDRVRGVTFDAFVRRSDRVFPDAKKIFAHPFVENPEAQLNKHAFVDNAESMLYKQNVVGKIYLGYDHINDKFEGFSPFIVGANKEENKMGFPTDVIKEIIERGGSMLAYVSKESIYDKRFKKDFEKYISICKPVRDPEALSIIKEVEEIIGAAGKKSDMIELMKQGVVIHHGSVPLNVRFLIEKFTNANHARICFATSTLIQGVNMPFDIVWIENLRFIGTEEDKTLGLKNLIGRAGRTTDKLNSFDYGFVVTNKIKKFIERFNGKTLLSDSSLLEEGRDSSEDLGDLKDFIDAVRANDLNDEYNLPNSKAERLQNERTVNYVRVALDALFKDGRIMTGTEYKDLSKIGRRLLKDSLAGIYEASLGRPLKVGESHVLSASITILLWQIQGKTFKELLALRYSFLTNQKKQRLLKKSFDEGSISRLQYEERLENLEIEYSAIPNQLPNSKLNHRPPSRFGKKKVKDFNYDLMVYDTYDFLDKVILFSLSDVYVAAFDQFYKTYNDPRAMEMTNYFKFGTNDAVEIWLMRYGFSIEEAEDVKEYVHRVDENEIIFSDGVYAKRNAPVFELIERYL